MLAGSMLMLAGMSLAACALAEPPPLPEQTWRMRPLPAQEEGRHEFRLRRLEKAISEGKLTPEEADLLRRRWLDAPPPPAHDHLTPEQRSRLRDYVEQRRRDREELLRSLSGEQRDAINRLQQAGTLDRRQFLSILTAEQRQWLLQRELQRRDERRRLLPELGHGGAPWRPNDPDRPSE